MNKKFAVVGSPIQHSKSPQIHQAAYRALNLNWQYAKFEVSKGSLANFLDDAGVELSGLSVTAPLKNEAFAMAKNHDENSNLTEVSNTLVSDGNGGWKAFNTDVFGICQAIILRERTAPKLSVIIGSGATATSTALAISKIAPRSKILIHARSAKNRKTLAKFARSLNLKVGASWSLAFATKKADLVVSTLPAHVMDDAALRLSATNSWSPSGMLLDVSYDPWPSKLAALWLKSGEEVISGKDMLIWQAIAQLRIFSSGDAESELPDEEKVAAAMFNAIRD